MNTLESLFPAPPVYEGSWQAVYLEPIIGSGEQITIAVVAFGQISQFKVIQAIKPELLYCLYGSKSANMQAMIDWVIDSIKSEAEKTGTLTHWRPPFAGVKLGPIHQAADDSIDGVLRQAIRFSASLYNLALDADKEDDDDVQTKQYSERWVNKIAEELKLINPAMSNCFKKKVPVSEAKVSTTYGYMTDRYVANFGLIIPTSVSQSLSSVKVKLFDLETLKKWNGLIKPEKFELIIGSASTEDPTLSNSAIKKINDTIQMLSELARSENIGFFKAETAKQAAEHLSRSAA